MDLETWLHDMSARAMPGGVAASAVAAAMGAALIAKALRVSLKREPFADEDRARLGAVLEQAHAEQRTLFHLAEADMQAYGAVIATRSLPEDDPPRRQVWRTATEVPIAVGEACYRLLDQLAGVLCQCWPGVCIDYRIGSELLAASARAVRLAAEADLEDWGESNADAALRARIEALARADETERLRKSSETSEV